MKIFEISDLDGEIKSNLDKYIKNNYKSKYDLEENRLRILVGNCELVGNKIICDKIEFKVLSKKLYKNLDKGDCYFLIDNKNRIVSEQINHIFCPYEIIVGQK